MSFRPEPFGSERLDMSRSALSSQPKGSSTCLKAELLKPKGSLICLTAEELSTGCPPLLGTWEYIVGEFLHPVYQRGHSKGSKVFFSLKNTLLKIHLKMCKKYRIMRSFITVLGKI
jgi:hypothetical protein